MSEDVTMLLVTVVAISVFGVGFMTFVRWYGGGMGAWSIVPGIVGLGVMLAILVGAPCLMRQCYFDDMIVAVVIVAVVSGVPVAAHLYNRIADWWDMRGGE